MMWRSMSSASRSPMTPPWLVVYTARILQIKLDVFIVLTAEGSPRTATGLVLVCSA